MRVCPHCSNLAPRDDARFCVHCGWPLVQACPYPSCGQEVPLLGQDGKPTPKCPHCNRPFRACSDVHCRRLHTYAEEKCRNPHAAPLTDASPGWVHEGGNPARTFCQQIGHAVDKVAPAGLTPDYQSPIGAVIAVAGEVRFTVREVMHAWIPGHSSTLPISLQAPVPPDPWRLLSVGGSIFVVGENAVEVAPLGASTTGAVLPGRYVSQTAIGRNWIGVRDAGDKCQIDIRDDEGREVETFEIPVPASALLPIVGAPESAFAVSVSARVWCVNRDGIAESSYPDVGQVLYAAFGRGLVRCGQRAGKTFVSQDNLLQPVERLVVPTCSPMIDGEQRIWLVGGTPAEAFVLNPFTLSVEETLPLGVANARRAILLDGPSKIVAVAGFDAHQQTVALVAWPGGGRVAEPFRTGPNASLHMAVGDGMLHLGVSYVGDHRVRSYKLGA